MADHDTPSEGASSSPPPAITSDIQPTPPPPQTPAKASSKGKGKAKAINTDDANKNGANSGTPPPSSAKKGSARNKPKWTEAPTLDDGEPKPVAWIKAKLPGPSTTPPVVYSVKESDNINYGIYQKPEIWKDEEFESDCPAFCLGDVTMKPDNLAHEEFWRAICGLWKTFNIRLWPRIERNAFVITAMKMGITKNTLTQSTNSLFIRLKDGMEQPMACHPMIISLIMGPEAYAQLYWFTGRWKNRYTLSEAHYKMKCDGINRENADKGSTTQWVDGKVAKGAFAPKVKARKNGKGKKDAPSAVSTPRKSTAEPDEVTDEPSIFVPGTDDQGGPVQRHAIVATPSRAMDIDENYDDDNGDLDDTKERVLQLKHAFKPVTAADDGSEQVHPDSSMNSEATGSCIEVATPRSLNDGSNEGDEDDLFEEDPPQDGLASSCTLRGGNNGAVSSPAVDDTMDLDDPENAEDDVFKPVQAARSDKKAAKAAGKAPSSSVTPLKKKRKAFSIEDTKTSSHPRKRGPFVPFNSEARDVEIIRTVDKFITGYNELIEHADNELEARRSRISEVEGWLVEVMDDVKEKEARVAHLEGLNSTFERQHAAGLEQMKAQDASLEQYKTELGKKDDELERKDGDLNKLVGELKKKTEELAKVKGELAKKVDEVANKEDELEVQKQEHSATATKLKAALAEKPAADAIPADAMTDGQAVATAQTDEALTKKIKELEAEIETMKNNTKTDDQTTAPAHPDEELANKVEKLKAQIKSLKKDNKNKAEQLEKLTAMLNEKNKADSSDGEDPSDAED